MINATAVKKYTISLILLSVLSLNSSQLSAQENPGFIKKLIKKFVSSEKDSSRSGSFVVLPAVGYAQETGFEYGIASTYNFYIDKENLEKLDELFINALKILEEELKSTDPGRRLKAATELIRLKRNQ